MSPDTAIASGPVRDEADKAIRKILCFFYPTITRSARSVQILQGLVTFNNLSCAFLLICLEGTLLSAYIYVYTYFLFIPLLIYLIIHLFINSFTHSLIYYSCQSKYVQKLKEKQEKK